MCKQSTAVQPKKEPEKVEVFVDGKPVQVEPNTTVLQVREKEKYIHEVILLFRLVLLLVWKFLVIVIMNDYPLLVIVGCVLLKSKKHRRFVIVQAMFFTSIYEISFLASGQLCYASDERHANFN